MVRDAGQSREITCGAFSARARRFEEIRGLTEDRFFSPLLAGDASGRVVYVRVQGILPYLVLAIAVFAAYSNIYGNTFLYDDNYLIVNNQFIRSWHYLPTL